MSVRSKWGRINARNKAEFEKIFPVVKKSYQLIKEAIKNNADRLVCKTRKARGRRGRKGKLICSEFNNRFKK